MAITAKLVKELRERTGAGMMDCKNALVETDGNLDAAVDLLREKGIAKAAKKAGKVAAEGGVLIKSDANQATLTELNCQTDFVAISEPFKNLHVKLTDAIFASKANNVEEAKASDVDGKNVDETLVEAVATIGENLQLRRISFMEKNDDEVFGTYVHANSKVGTLVKVKGSDEEFAKGVAMHVAAINPQFVDGSDVPAEVVAKEKAIFEAEVKETMADKPEKVIENIIKGKVAKFLKEICLLDQKFVIDDSKTVKQAAKDAGCEVVEFVRFEVGEGIEKEEKDFAAEVASQVG